MRITAQTGFVCLFFAAMAAASYKEGSGPAVTVRLYNPAGLRESEISRAIAEASWAFSKVGVRAIWIRCPPVGEHNSCRENADPGVVSIGITMAVPEFSSPGALGFSLMAAGNRNHAAILYPRIVELARANPIFAEREHILAYAIIHEIVHLILGSTAHGGEGIMRSPWGESELRAIGQRRLRLTLVEEADLKRKLSQEQAQALNLSRHSTEQK